MASTEEAADVGTLVAAIGQDLKSVASAHLAIAKDELAAYLKRTVFRASVMLLGAFVGMIGLAMLSVVVVLLLQPWIAMIWLRLLLTSIVYIAVGSLVARWFMKHVISAPELGAEKREARETLQAVKNGIESEDSHG